MNTQADKHQWFADVLLPLPLAGTFTYRVPVELVNFIQVGERVAVPFGRQKVYAGLVKQLHQTPPNVPAKYLLYLLDEYPVVTPLQLQFWQWIADYYLCHEGEVMHAAMPAAFKLQSESKVMLNEEFDGDVSSFSPKEMAVMAALSENKELSLEELKTVCEQQKIFPLIKTLNERGVIFVEEELSERYKPKTEWFVSVVAPYTDNAAFSNLIKDLSENKKTARQADLLLSFMALSKNNLTQPIQKTELLKKSGLTNTQLQSLIKKGVFACKRQAVSRLDSFAQTAAVSDIRLSSAQTTAFNEITTGLQTHNAVLLYGDTGSGKTELYIKLIDEVLRRGEQVLYLLPEIALTTQIVNRLRKYFGDKVGVYHSRFGGSERVEIWNSLLNAPNTSHSYQLIIGARSALFLPFQKLGLIIIDEEHDSSFKQYDPAPRYQARDAAIVLANMHKAKALLGTATPSIESYLNAQKGVYAYVRLQGRYADEQAFADSGTQAGQCKFTIIDTQQERRDKHMHSHFSEYLLNRIEECVSKGEQVIIFQNRRGFSLRIECQDCGHIPSCPNCDVSLTYHKTGNGLKCHYCEHYESVPSRCPVCNSTNLQMKGFGTEKIEEELPIFIPNIRITRLDSDSIRAKDAMQRIVAAFENKEIDVLVGTQMVTKGLDFDNVGLVAVLNADNMLSFPDFRAAERTFQMLVQVAGRAGRRSGTTGEIIIQTSHPEHTVIGEVIRNDFETLAHRELSERTLFGYPPTCRMIRLTLRHKEEAVVAEGARTLAQLLRQSLHIPTPTQSFAENLLPVSGSTYLLPAVLGPETPIVSRIKTYYLRDIVVKLKRNKELATLKHTLLQTLNTFAEDKRFRSIKIAIDTDPA